MRWRGVRTVLGAVLVVVVTSAGACRQEHDGPLPSPAAAGAGALPPGVVTDGLDATYARLTRQDGDGTQCFHLVRLTPDGTAEMGQGCGSDAAAGVASAEQTWATGEPVGDYGYGAGRLLMRVVSWDSLAEEVVLDEYEAAYCDARLSLDGADTGRLYDLVAGRPPGDAATC